MNKETKQQTVSIVHGSVRLTLEFDKTPIPFQDALCFLEKAVIGHFLNENKGIKCRAAKQLMLNRTTLVEKARKYGFPIQPLKSKKK